MRPDQLLASTRPQFFTETLEAQFKLLAKNEYPKEACAYVINDRLVPVANVSLNPEEEFDLTVTDALLMETAQGFIHSHPNGNGWPSALDMQTQIQWNKPFGVMAITETESSPSIWWGDQTLSLPLNERPFVHGILDCYSLIRAEKFQRTGIILPDYPRDFEWWERGENTQNLYEDNFRNAGYEVIDADDYLQLGDVVFMKIHTDVVSHAAIYQENGLILHHLRDRFSRIEHISPWKKFIEKIVRYRG